MSDHNHSDEQTSTIQTPRIVVAGIPRSGTRYVFHQLGGKKFKAITGNLIKTHGLAPPDSLPEPQRDRVECALLAEGYKAIFMFGDVTHSILSTINNIYDTKHFRNCGCPEAPSKVSLLDRDWLNYEQMFDSWMRGRYSFPCMCLRYETLPSFAEEFYEFTGVKPDFSNFRPRKTTTEGVSTLALDQINKTYSSLIRKVKYSNDITIYNGSGRRESKMDEPRKEVKEEARKEETRETIHLSGAKWEPTVPETKKEVAFFGPWIGEFGWELLTWQAWCRQEAKKYEKVYCCSFPDMEPLYRDFAEFIPHNHKTRALDWHKQENMDKANYEVPMDVTKQILPFKRYKPEGDFIRFGRKREQPGFSNLIHARGIKRGGKDYPLDLWKELVNGLEGTIACVGTERDHLIEGTVDLRGIPLDQLMDVMANSGVVIGQSSGVMHLATLCKTPIVVWGDSRTYFNETLDVRYFETWNPFKSKVWYVADDNWKPSPKLITDRLKPDPSIADPTEPAVEPPLPPSKPAMVISDIDPKEPVIKGAEEIPVASIPIGKTVRDKLAKATMAGRYFITISVLGPDDKLYHYFKTQDFPKGDVFRSLEHITSDAKKKYLQVKDGRKEPKTFKWE